MIKDVRYPFMRFYVMDSLKSFADIEGRQKDWGVYDPVRKTYEDLTLNINILYDNSAMPHPQVVEGTIFLPDEIEPLCILGGYIDSLIEDHGDQPDSAYLDDARWPLVVESARKALAKMEENPPDLTRGRDLLAPGD